MHIHHIGYLVKRLEKARPVFTALGYTETGEVVYDKYRDVDVLFMKKDGYTIELVSPKSDGSVVAELIKKYKNAPYHICYISGDLETDSAHISENGFIRIDEPTPAPALGGQRVCFFMSPYVGMLELLEEKECMMPLERERERDAAGRQSLHTGGDTGRDGGKLLFVDNGGDGT